MLCYTYLWCSQLSIIDFFSFSFSFSIAIRPAHIDYLSILLFGDSDIFAHFSCSLSHSRSLRFFFFLISVVTVAVMLLLHIFSDFFFATSTVAKHTRIQTNHCVYLLLFLSSPNVYRKEKEHSAHALTVPA